MNIGTLYSQFSVHRMSVHQQFRAFNSISPQNTTQYAWTLTLKWQFPTHQMARYFFFPTTFNAYVPSRVRQCWEVTHADPTHSFFSSALPDVKETSEIDIIIAINGLKWFCNGAQNHFKPKHILRYFFMHFSILFHEKILYNNIYPWLLKGIHA